MNISIKYLHYSKFHVSFYMEFFICTHCEKQFESIEAISKHRGRIHKLNAEDTYHHYILKGQAQPTCSCGCGGKTKFISLQKGYRPFINAHNNKVPGNNNFHKNPESKIKSARTQSENWAKGLYKGWWEDDSEETRQKIEGIKEKLRNDKERGKKISESLKGHDVSEETKKKIGDKATRRFIDRPELRTNLSEKRLQWMRDNSEVKTSKLEDKFEQLMVDMGLIKDVHYIKNHLVVNIKTFFDFYLPNHNIIIEVDGDFYHCNPTTHPIPVYEIQKKNLANDKRKNSWAKNHGVRLLRYWESDINQNPEGVIGDLKNELSLIT
jgi:very-short-patch-repair endonuclease